MKRFEQLTYSNSFARLAEGQFHVPVVPHPLQGSRLLHTNAQTAAVLGLDLSGHSEEELHAYFSGRRPLPGCIPRATVYAGHQFGYFVPQLGDGRALLMGEVRGADGESWELQLKGSGRTPFSRQGDGRAVLRSTIREYLCSQAMVGLGIPTTRALALVGSDEPVRREREERAAMLVRVAPSHIRFGHFEYFFHRRKREPLKALADFVIDQHYPEVRDDGLPYLSLFEQVVERTAHLIARWQLAGFAHGVMNTDNMSILGLTLDYGPYGFMDNFDPGYVCNHSDYEGRYAYDQQPYIAQWNLSRLGQTLLHLFDDTPACAAEMANGVLGTFEARFYYHYEQGLNAKLGLVAREADDFDLGMELLEWMGEYQVDYTRLFRALGDVSRDAKAPLPIDLAPPEALAALHPWLRAYRKRLTLEGRGDSERRAAMERVNPLYILRNHLAQQAISAAESGHMGEMERLFELLSDPFTARPGAEAYAAAAPAWSKQLLISCSS